MITSIPLRPEEYVPGKCHSYRNNADSAAPLEAMPFGYGAVRGAVSPNTARLPLQNQVIFTLSTDLGASNVFAGKLQATKIDGTELDPDDYEIEETYASSHSATVDGIAAALEALDSDISVSLSSNKRVITVSIAGNKKLEVDTTFAVTGGSAVTVTTTYNSTDKNRGVVEKRDLPMLFGFTGVQSAPQYEPAQKQMAGIIHQGDPVVPVTGSPKAGGAVYLLYKDYTDSDDVLNARGTYRTNDDDGDAPVILVSNAEWADVARNGYAPMAINNP